MTNTKQFIEDAIEGGWGYDKEDEEKLSEHSWNTTDKGYLVTTINCKRVKMHHFLIGKEEEKYVDHINRDRVDNRKENLRFVTPQQNRFNTGAKGYRKRGEKWDAQIMLNKKQIHLGTFETEEEAKTAYQLAKVIHHLI